jgi:hypothetical protein
LKAILRSPNLKRKVSGIVTIATPFLIFSEHGYGLALLPAVLENTVKGLADYLRLFLVIFLVRPLLVACWLLDWLRSGRKAWLLSACIVALGVAVSPFTAHLSAAFNTWAFGRGWQFTSVCMILVGALVAVTVLWFHLPDAVSIKRFHFASRRLFRRYSYSQPEGALAVVPLLTLSSLLDEAFVALTGSWLTHRTTGWVCRVAISAAIVISVAIAGAAGYGALLLGRPAVVYGTWYLRALARTGGKLFLVASCLLAVVQANFLVKVFLAILGCSSPGLGFARPGDNLLLNVRAERNPALSTVTSIRYRTWQLLRQARGRLVHSRIYSYPAAVRDIAEWMKSRQAPLYGHEAGVRSPEAQRSRSEKVPDG